MTTHTLDDDDDDRRRRLDLQLWRRLLVHARSYRRAFGLMGVLGLCVAGIDTALPLVTAQLIDAATVGEGATLLRGHGILYAAMLLGLAGAIWGFIVLAGRISTGIAHDLRRASFARLQELSFSFYDVRAVGWLVARLTSDCAKVSGILPWFLLDLVWGTALLVGISVAMLWLDPALGLVVMGVVPPLVVLSLWFQRMMLESSRQVRKTNAQMTASFSEAIAGVRTTKVLAREPENLREFQGLSSTMFSWSMRHALQSALYLPLVILVGSVGVGLALWKGGVDVGLGVSLGTLVAFMQYATLFSMPIQDLARQFTMLQAAQAAAERVQELLETEPDIADSPRVRRNMELAAQAADPARAIDGGDPRISSIEFRNVSFSYKSGEPVLQACSFSVTAGQTVALVGPTGGGKSTIVSLLSRFYEVTEGAILVDGVDIRERSLAWLQSQLGVVLQTPHLFSGTVADNIRYGRLDATDEEVRRAAEIVHAHRFITRLPDGYATQVGEGGGKLSTGQRQLVSLSRAVLADPQIFVMDEATSSVDTETERAIQAGIDAVLAGRIAFVIAHRLSTIRSADLILVVDHGRIVERGDHASLLALRGRYHRLWHEHRVRDSLRQSLPPGTERPLPA
jgi:ATP-binding cassette subfamily B protein